MQAVVYTKDGCVYCDRAKELLEDMDINYTEAHISEYKLTYLGSAEAACTSPQIFLDDVHVGGYSDLLARLQP